MSAQGKLLIFKEVLHDGKFRKVQLFDCTKKGSVLYEIRVEREKVELDNAYSAFRVFVLLCEALAAGKVALDSTTLAYAKGAITQKASVAKSESSSNQFTQWAIRAVGRQRYLSIFRRALKQTPQVIQDTRATNES